MKPATFKTTWKTTLKNFIGTLLDSYLILTFLIILTKMSFLANALSLKMTTELLLINTGLSVLLLAPAYCFGAKIRKIYLYLANVFCSCLFIADLLYFRYFGTPASIYIFFQSSNLDGLSASILHLVEWSDLLYLLDLLLLPFFFFFTSLRVLPSKGFACGVLILGLILTTYCPLLNYYQGKSFRRFNANDTLYAFGPLGFHVMDTAYFIKDRNLQLTPEMEKEILAWFTNFQAQQEHHPTSPYWELGKGKNLIVLQVESLQNFVIGAEINNQEITPHLNKLLKNSLYFPHFYPQTIAGNSSDAELICNTSLYPLKQGSTFFVHPHNQYYSLPLLLKEKNYQTMAIHADEATYWNRHQVYPYLGFDEYISIEKMQMTEQIGMGLSDEAMFQQTLPLLKATEQPFYAFIITLTNHYPYYMPAEKAFLELPSTLQGSHVGNYLQSVHYTDMTIGLFMKELSENGLLENTVVAIYGDHDGLFKRDKTEIEDLLAHKPISDEEWIRTYVPVPLLLYDRKLEGKTIPTYGGQVDFLPTISHLLGLESANHPFAMGANLLTNKKGSALIPSGDYITAAAKVTPAKVETSLSSSDEHTLNIADLLIKTNFCALQKTYPTDILKK